MIESNGGTRRIEVRIERPAEQVVIPESAAGRPPPRSHCGENELSRTVARLRPGVRIAIGCAAARSLFDCSSCS